MFEHDLKKEVKKRVENIFKKKMKQLKVKAELDLDVVESIYGPPIADENVYGEAFPFKNPPKIWLEVFIPDATEKEITKTICHELMHIKYPKLKDGDLKFERKIQTCSRRVYRTPKQNIFMKTVKKQKFDD